MLFGKFTESQSKGFDQEVIEEEGPAEDYGYLSDSDLEDDEDEEVAGKTRSGALSFDSSTIPGEPGTIDCEKYEEHVNEGKVVKILDVAFVT